MEHVVSFRRLDMLKGTPQPFPYQGSKRYLANAIVPLIPDGVNRIIEPFCGSAAVSIAARQTGKAQSAVIADINAPLIDLWNEILKEPDRLIAGYTYLWNEQLSNPREYFKEVRDSFNETHKPEELLYLLNRIVKGAVRYGKDGKFNQSADNRRLGAKPETVRQRILQVSKLMTGTVAIADHFASVVEMADPDDVIYMDPPYQGTSNNPDHRYAANLRRADFEPILHGMNERGLSYMVSYDVVDSARTYGEPLSKGLALTHIHLVAGVSAQSVLLGDRKQTLESLYLSPALVDRIGGSERIETLLNDGSEVLF